MTSDLLLVGAGGHARSCIDIIETAGVYRIAGLIGKQTEIGNQELGHKVIGQDNDLALLVKQYPSALITVGQIKSAALRVKLFNLIQKYGYATPTIISPSAYVSKHASIGKGSVVMHGAVVNAGVKIGDNCIINSGSIIEHDAIVGAHTHISVGAILNGGVSVASETFVGSGSLIKEGLSIGSRCVIGMGVVVRYDVENDRVVTRGESK